METADKIMEFVCKQMEVSRKDIQSDVRSKHLVDARHMFVLLARQSGRMSWPSIGRALHRDHSSCMYLYYRKSARVSNSLSGYMQDLGDPTPKVKYIPSQSYRELFSERGGACEICSFNDVVEVHHLLSKKVGGTDRKDNLMVLCPNHHSMLHAGLVHINPASYPHLTLPVTHDLSTSST